MAYEVLMPQLGLTMEEGTVSQWIKHEGDAVKAGDVVVEITTDKLTNEITSEQDGVLLKIVAQEGADVPVKGLLGYIGRPGEQVGVPTAAAAPAAPAVEAAAAPLPGAQRSGRHHIRHTSSVKARLTGMQREWIAPTAPESQPHRSQ